MSLCSLKCLVFWDLKAAQAVSKVWFCLRCKLIKDSDSGLGDELPAQCALCLESLGLTSFYRLLPCGHPFHLQCIDKWLCNEDASCPLCRQTFYELRRPKFLYILPSKRADQQANYQSEISLTAVKASMKQAFRSIRGLLPLRR